MADATPALETLEAELTQLKVRLATTDPRKQAINRLKFKVAGKFGGTARAAEIAALERATAAVSALPDEADFAATIASAEDAVDAVRAP